MKKNSRLQEVPRVRPPVIFDRRMNTILGPAKKDASEDTSGIGTALNNATKSDMIQPSIHRARKRRTTRAETIKQAEPIATNSKRLKER